MQPVEPGSPSIILRATTIVAVRIDAAEAGPPRPTADGWNERSVTLGLFLAEILKGEVMEPPASRVTARVTQFENPSPMYMPVPGIWSPVALEAGTALLVFATGRRQVPQLAALLVEPACIGLRQAAEAAPGVRLAMRYLTGAMSASAFLDAAATIRLDDSFAELLGQLLRHDPAFATREVFPRFTALLLRPNLDPPVRTMLIDAAVHAPAESPAFDRWHADQVIIALIRAALVPDAAALRHNILSVDLPPLLGLRGGQPRAASQVFHDQPALRLQLAAALRNEPAGAPVVRWLEAP